MVWMIEWWRYWCIEGWIVRLVDGMMKWWNCMIDWWANVMIVWWMDCKIGWWHDEIVEWLRVEVTIGSPTDWTLAFPSVTALPRSLILCVWFFTALFDPIRSGEPIRKMLEAILCDSWTYLWWRSTDWMLALPSIAAIFNPFHVVPRGALWPYS